MVNGKKVTIYFFHIYYTPESHSMYNHCLPLTPEIVYPGKRENNDGSHTRGRNFIIYSCLDLYYVVKELYANL